MDENTLLLMSTQQLMQNGIQVGELQRHCCTQSDQVRGNVQKGRQRRSRAFVVLTYSVYAPRAKVPAALLGGLFEHSLFLLATYLNRSDSTGGVRMLNCSKVPVQRIVADSEFP